MARRTLSRSRAILTGASSGIGRALALELAGRGARLILNARRDDRLRELAEAIRSEGGAALSVPGDVSDAALRRRLVETAERELSGLDLLVNNAGMGRFGPFAESDEARLRQTMEVNFFAPAELIRAALPLLRTGERPMVVNISSVLGHFSMPHKSEYCASKFALHGFSDALRMELRPAGIDVLVVSPSTTATEFFDKAENDPGRRPKRGMSPEKVASKTARAMERGRREIILSPEGNLAVWADRLTPGLMNWAMAKWGG
jgi:short-subunit dehydrogenase